MIADDLELQLGGVVGVVVGDSGHGRGLVDDGTDQVGLVVVGFALEDLRHALEAHAGVDVLVLERRRLAAGVAVHLHEHEVVKLDEARIVLEVGTLGTPLRVEVPVQLGARAARASRTRGPEVVRLVQALDALLRDSHDVAPDGVGLVVLPEDGDVDASLVEAVLLRGELPRVLDCLLLEVVAEGEVAEHLEEGVVPRGDAHVLDVVGPDAFLGGGGARDGALRLTHEDGLELEHSRDGEQHGGVLRDERGGGQARVAPLLVKLEEPAADAGAGDVLAGGILEVGRLRSRRLGGG